MKEDFLFPGESELCAGLEFLKLELRQKQLFRLGGVRNSFSGLSRDPKVFYGVITREGFLFFAESELLDTLEFLKLKLSILAGWEKHTRQQAREARAATQVLSSQNSRHLICRCNFLMHVILSLSSYRIHATLVGSVYPTIVKRSTTTLCLCVYSLNAILLRACARAVVHSWI